MKSNSTLKYLMEQAREIEISPENVRRKQKWNYVQPVAREQWRGVPRNDRSWKEGIVPIQADPSYTFWANYFDFSLKEYFLNWEVYLENYLKIAIERFKLFDDDVYMIKRIPIWPSVAFEASVIGLNVLFYDKKDPVAEYKILINDRSDLERLGFPDFYKSGLMPKCIEMYERMKEAVDDDFEVIFPEMLKGPFAMAVYSMGYENLLLNMYDDPEFIHIVMGHYTKALQTWYDERDRYTGEKHEKGCLYNDDINSPTISPQHYKEFVFPYEQELYGYHNGLYYWHSCGNVTKMLEQISKLGYIELINRGPWTDAGLIAKHFNESAIEICLNPTSEILESNEEKMVLRIGEIIGELEANNCAGFTLRANNIDIYNSVEYSIKRMQEFIKASRRAVSHYIA